MLQKNIFFLVICFSTLKIIGNYFPTFHQAMECSGRYNSEFTKLEHWKRSKQLYDAFTSRTYYQDMPKIPKIIHQIWIGTPFPQRYIAFQKSWKKQHPDWKYKLWTDKEIRDLKLTNQNMYDKASNYGEKSDIARYEILYRFGGLYVDTDFECLNSFDFLHHSCSFYAGFLYPNKAESFEIANGLLGAAPTHPVLKECIDTMKDGGGNSPMATISRTGPHHLSLCYRRLLLTGKLPDDTVVLPTNFFYSFPAWERFEMDSEKIKDWIKEYSLAVHYWHCSWQK